MRAHTHTLTVVLGDALVVAMLPPLPPSVPSLAMSNAGLDFASDIASSRYCYLTLFVLAVELSLPLPLLGRVVDLEGAVRGLAALLLLLLLLCSALSCPPTWPLLDGSAVDAW